MDLRSMHEHEMPTVFPAASSASSSTQPIVPPSADASSALPKVAGFMIEGELGRGGMGIVYLARQIRLNRLVALKMILNPDHSDADTKLRFLGEAEAIARLHHAGIVQVHEFGTHENNPYFSLEYVEGGSLDKKLAGTPLKPFEAADLVEKIARAVQSAHDQGIIHRDLKPANILLADAASSGNSSHSKLSATHATQRACPWQPKITDFGLVKKEGSDMTATGAILGTPSYMAPEQADAKKTIGPAVDIYALGAILYECLTGRPPFKAATPIDTILQVINQEPVSIRQLQSKTPLDLETICLKCLQKEPGKRYASASVLADDLLHYLRNEPISARPVSRIEKAWRWCRRYPMVAGLAASVALLLVSVAVGSLFVSLAMGSMNSQLSDSNQQLSSINNALAKAEDAATKNADAARLDRERARDLLCKQYEINAAKMMDEGDTGGAMLWSAAAIKEAGGNEERERAPRMRFAQLLKTQPRPVQVWETSYHELIEDERPRLSPDGQKLIITSESGVNYVDLATGKSLLTAALPARSEVFKTASSPDGSYLAIAFHPKKEVHIDSTAYQMLQMSLCEVTSRMGLLIFAAMETASSKSTCVIYNLKTNSIIKAETLLAYSYAMKFSNDSRYLYVSNDILLSESGKRVSTLPITKSPEKFAFSRDSKRLLVTYDSHYARIAQEWDIEKANWIGSGVPQYRELGDVTYDNQDTPLVVVLSRDNNYRQYLDVWNVRTGKRLFGPADSKDTDSIYRYSFSPGGTRILTQNNTASKVWHITTGKLLCTVDVGTNMFISNTKTASFSLDGNKLIIIRKSGVVMLWDIERDKALSEPILNPVDVSYAQLNSSSDKLIVGDVDGNLTLWNLTPQYDYPNGKQVIKELAVSLYCKLRHEGAVFWTAQNIAGNQLMTLSESRSGKPVCAVWNMIPENIVSAAKIPSAIMIKKAKILDDKSAFILDYKKAANISLMDGANLWPTLHLNDSGTTDTYFSRRGKLLLTDQHQFSGSDVVLTLWNAPSGVKVKELLTSKNGRLNDVCFSHDETRCAALFYDEAQNRVIPYLWDTSTGLRVAAEGIQFSYPKDRMVKYSNYHAIMLDNDKYLWLFARNEGEVACHDAKTAALLPSPGKLKGSFLRHDETSHTIITSDSAKKSTSLFDVNQLSSPRWTREFEANLAEYDRSGKLIAFASGGSSWRKGSLEVRVRQSQTGTPLSPSMVHQGEVKIMRFSQDSQFLVCLTNNDSKHFLHCWHISSGLRMMPPLPLSEEVLDVAFVQEDNQLVGVSSNGTIYRWDMVYQKGNTDQLTQLTQALTGRRFDEVGAIIPVAFDRRMKMYDDVRNTMPELLSSSSRSLNSWYQSQLESAKDNAERLRIYQKMIEANPTDFSLLLQRGTTLRAEGRNEESVADFVKYVAAKPDEAQARLGLAHSRSHASPEAWGIRQLRDLSWDDAYADLELALSNKNPLITNWEDLACPCRQLVARVDAGMVRYQQAAKLLTRACKIAPNNSALYRLLGKAYYRSTNYTAAIQVLSAQAMESYADVEDIAILSMAYSRSGQSKEAQSTLDKALKIWKTTKQSKRPPLLHEAVVLLQKAP